MPFWPNMSLQSVNRVSSGPSRWAMAGARLTAAMTASAVAASNPVFMSFLFRIDATTDLQRGLPRVGETPPSAFLTGVIWNLMGPAKAPIANRSNVFAAWQTLRTRRAYRRSAPPSAAECRGSVTSPSSRYCQPEPAEDASGLRSREDDRVEAEPAAIAVQGEYQHQQEQKEIGPRPLARSTVEAEPQIDDLKRADHPPQTHKEPE